MSLGATPCNAPDRLKLETPSTRPRLSTEYNMQNGNSQLATGPFWSFSLDSFFGVGLRRNRVDLSGGTCTGVKAQPPKEARWYEHIGLGQADLFSYWNYFGRATDQTLPFISLLFPFISRPTTKQHQKPAVAGGQRHFFTTKVFGARGIERRTMNGVDGYVALLDTRNWWGRLESFSEGRETRPVWQKR